MIQPDARHPETEQESDSLLHVTALRGNQNLTDGQQLSTQLREPDSHCADAILTTANHDTSCPRRPNGNPMTKSNLPKAIGLDEVADPEAFNLQVIQILTDIPADQEGGN